MSDLRLSRRGAFATKHADWAAQSRPTCRVTRDRNIEDTVMDQRSNSPKTLVATDDVLRKSIKGADIPALLATVAYLTRDPSALRPEWRPKLDYGVAVSGLSEDEERAVRQFCFERLAQFRDSGQGATISSGSAFG